MRSRLHPESEIDLGPCWSELDAVLNSRLFSHARSLSKILSFICTRRLEDEGDSINEWSIAVEGLGRTDFHPEKHSIVRVEFHHLRKRLAQYYQTEGADHPVRIVLPDSGYVPCFDVVVPGAASQAELPGSALPEAAEEMPAGPAAARTDGTPAAAASAGRRMWILTVLAGAALATAAVAIGHRVLAAKPATGLRASSVAARGPAESIRLLAGFDGPAYIDSSGRAWEGDRYFDGGVSFNRPDPRIYRTPDPAIFGRGREGEFRYDIPVKPGRYELRLHFAETRYGQSPLEGAEAMRRFDVFLNGRKILADFDVTRDAGATDTATTRVWEDVAPAADGLVHLLFTGHSGPPMLNALELVPNPSGELLPVRIVVGRHAVYDRQGRFWSADNYFFGGRSVDRLASIQNTSDPGLFAGVRFGNFSYAIPVVQGRTYQLTLGFAESAYDFAGERVFDILCNGRTLLRNFDILAAAGGKDRAVTMAFKNLEPNAQSKLDLSFVPSRDYASLSFLEIVQAPSVR